MKEKFQTVEAFVNAAMATKNPMMKEIQQNKDAIEAAAKELGTEGEPRHQKSKLHAGDLPDFLR